MPGKRNPFPWLTESIESRPGCVVRMMFGGYCCYLDGKLVLVLASGEEPWNGALYPAEREHHPSLLEEFPHLTNHEILPKWLYLSQSDEEFEDRARKLVQHILDKDPRFGVIPKPRKRKSTAKKSPKKKAKPDGRPGWME